MLDHDISHIPITETDELIGMVCAKDIVQTFIVPMGAMTVGERSGEKIARFEGDVNAIMDASPIIARGETPTVTIIQELIERGKSACVIVDPNKRIQGIITPRELLTPIAHVNATRSPSTLSGYQMRTRLIRASRKHESVESWNAE
jgi:CBS-domain-containing membrane protein